MAEHDGNMHSAPFRIVGFVLVIVGGGCASLATTQADYRDRASTVTRERASFDLSCSSTELVVTPLGDESFMTTAHEYQVVYGVTGCGTKATYLATCERTNKVKPVC